jgi:FKBP-type peptidyl-prolyl cis-trans isomerase SlyD
MKAQILSFHCVLKNKLGQTLSSSFNQDVINQPYPMVSHGAATPRQLQGLVAGIQNVQPGERRQFSVPAAEAYGLYHPELVMCVDRADLDQGERLRVGSEVMGLDCSDSKNKNTLYRVIQAQDNELVLDGNHPLAGQDLVFDIQVVSARDALSIDLEPSPLPIHLN